MFDVVIDDVGVGSNPARTAVPAVLFTWAANLDLLSAETASAAPMTRLKMRDLPFNDAFITTCHGKLCAEHLQPTLAAWLAEHYADFQSFARKHLDDEPFDSRQPWSTYDALAPWLTEHWLSERGLGRRQQPSGSLVGRWLQRWRR